MQRPPQSFVGAPSAVCGLTLERGDPEQAAIKLWKTTSAVLSTSNCGQVKFGKGHAQLVLSLQQAKHQF